MSNRQLTERQREAIKWITALRSGYYKQTAGTIRQTMVEGGMRFCAVGVYYDITHSESEYDFYAVSVFGSDLVERVISLNDSAGLSFSKIADYIEQEVFARPCQN